MRISSICGILSAVVITETFRVQEILESVDNFLGSDEKQSDNNVNDNLLPIFGGTFIIRQWFHHFHLDYDLTQNCIDVSVFYLLIMRRDESLQIFWNSFIQSCEFHVSFPANIVIGSRHNNNNHNNNTSSFNNHTASSDNNTNSSL